jgi:very-short-patch-repair endonuclease
MDEDTREFARHLRQNMSLPEMLIWSRIRGRHEGVPRFKRNHPIGPYFADFYCAKAMLVIEIDGASHGQGDRPERDEKRDAWMKAEGYEIMRIPAQDVLSEPDEMVQGMLNLVADRVRDKHP